MPKPAVPPKCVNGKDASDNVENEVGWFVVFTPCNIYF